MKRMFLLLVVLLSNEVIADVADEAMLRDCLINSDISAELDLSIIKFKGNFSPDDIGSVSDCLNKKRVEDTFIGRIGNSIEGKMHTFDIKPGEKVVIETCKSVQFDNSLYFDLLLSAPGQNNFGCHACCYKNDTAQATQVPDVSGRWSLYVRGKKSSGKCDSSSSKGNHSQGVYCLRVNRTPR